MSRIKATIMTPRILALLDQCLVSGSNFFVLIYLGRKLSHSDFGYFSLALLSVLFISNIHRAVITRPMEILDRADNLEASIARLNSLIRMVPIEVLLATLVLGTLSAYFFPDPSLLVTCVIYWVCFSLQETTRRYWYRINNLKHVLRADVVSYGGQIFLLLLAGIIWDLSGSTAFSIMAATSLLAFTWDILALKKYPRSPCRSMKDVFMEQWVIAKWLILTVLAVWGAGQIYPLLVAPLGSVAVATFAACSAILRGINVPLQAIDSYLPARVAAVLHQRGAKEFKSHLHRTVLLGSLAGLIFVMLIYVFARSIIHVAYSGAFDSAASILEMLLPGAFFMLIGTILGCYSLALSDSRASFIANIVAMVWTFTAGLWLIHAWGIAGAAAASSIASATAAFAQAALVYIALRKLDKGSSMQCASVKA